MITEENIRVKTCVLKVGIHCDGCKKKVTKVLNKIEGVYQINIEKLEGKVTVTGQMDLDTVFEKLRKAGKPAFLWGATANPGAASQVPQLQLGGGGEGQPKGGAGAAASSSGGGGDARMAMPQAATPQQLREQLQQQLMKGMQLPPQLMGMGGGKMPIPAAAAPANPKAVKFNVPEDDDGDSGDEYDDQDFEDDGLDDDTYVDDPKMMKKPMAMPAAASGAGGSGVRKGGSGKNGGARLNLGGAGGSGKNGGVAPPPRNGKGAAPGGVNLQPGQARKASGAGGPSAGVGGPMVGLGGGMPAPQPAAMMVRPPNMMGGAAGYPGAGQMGGMPMGHPGHMAAKGMHPGGVNGMQPGGGAGMLMGQGMQPGGVHGMQPAGGVAGMHAGGMPMGHPNMAGNGGMQPGAGGSAGGKLVGHPHMSGNNGMQPGGGGAATTTLAPGFYHAGPAGGSYGGGMPYGQEMMQPAGGNHVHGGYGCGGYMPMMQQQQQPPHMMMNGHGYGPQGYYGYHGGDHVHGSAAGYYQQSGYGSYGYGQKQFLPYPSYYPRHPHDNMFSDENPNSYCSVM